eukprot:2690775-Pleurochrysis_carterae.AAC.1
MLSCGWLRQMSMDERQQEIKVHSEVLKAQHKAAEDERHLAARQKTDRLRKVTASKASLGWHTGHLREDGLAQQGDCQQGITDLSTYRDLHGMKRYCPVHSRLPSTSMFRIVHIAVFRIVEKLSNKYDIICGKLGGADGEDNNGEHSQQSGGRDEVFRHPNSEQAAHLNCVVGH